MPEADPKAAEDTSATMNIKEQVDDGTAFRRALNDIMIQSVSAHQAVMTAITQAVQSNQDMRDKLVLKLLETGPVEAASIAAVLQQAIKAAQTTPPQTGVPKT